METVVAQGKILARRDGESFGRVSEIGEGEARLQAVAVSFVTVFATHHPEERFLPRDFSVDQKQRRDDLESLSGYSSKPFDVVLGIYAWR